MVILELEHPGIFQNIKGFKTPYRLNHTIKKKIWKYTGNFQNLSGFIGSSGIPKKSVITNENTKPRKSYFWALRVYQILKKFPFPNFRVPEAENSHPSLSRICLHDNDNGIC